MVKSLVPMTVPDNVFQYSPLPEHGVAKTIRLLFVAAGSDGDEIECLLLDSDLAVAANTFEALSYVWGDASEEAQKSIKVNGSVFKVGTTLHSALIHLRSREDSRVLWVDAICINQQDNTEKANQLGLMRDIYRTASQTVAWLGEATQDTDKVFRAVRLLGHEAREMEALNKTPQPEQGPVYQQLATDGSALEFDCIMKSSWCKRVWTFRRSSLEHKCIIVKDEGNANTNTDAVLEEIILAQRGTLQVGHEKVDWDFFSQAIHHAQSLHLFASSYLGTSMNCISHPIDMVLATKKAPTLGNPALEFLSHVNSSHFRNATDPRDKLFGLLGLVPTDIGIKVDYDADPSDVFVQSTRALIEATGDLDVLGFCYPYKIGNLDTPLPSWVPQWGSTGTFARPMMNYANGERRASNASRGLPCTPGWTDDGKTMILRGFVVDTVKRLTSVLPSLFLDNEHEGSFACKEEYDKALLSYDASQSVWDMCRETWGVCQAAGNLVAGSVAQLLNLVTDVARYIEWEDFVQREMGGSTEACSKVLCEVLSVGTQYPGGPAETEAEFAKWSKSLSWIRNLRAGGVHRMSTRLFQVTGLLLGVGAEFTKESTTFSGVLGHTPERRMGVTRAGRICLLPKLSEEGDQVVILKGGRVPVVLRPKGDGCVQVVGEAYVHGIMDGEVVGPEVCWTDLWIS